MKKCSLGKTQDATRQRKRLRPPPGGFTLHTNTEASAKKRGTGGEMTLPFINLQKAGGGARRVAILFSLKQTKKKHENQKQKF